MPRLISGSLREGAKIVSDPWHTVANLAEALAIEAGLDVVVPLDVLLEHKTPLSERTGRLGVLLKGSDDPARVADALAQITLVAIEFAAFTDGRGYSIARLLRERYGYGGELRAVGDVLRDQIFYMLRCGFDSFALREDKDLEEALGAFADFSEAYQSGVDQPLPLYRRRLAGLPMKEGTPS